MRMAALAATFLTALVLGGCGAGGDGGTPGDAVTVDGNDTTPPTLRLSAAETGGGNPQVDVQPGGASATLTLRTKTESINVIAIARDDESGVQKVEIWVNKRTATCSAGRCTSTGPGLLGSPRFQSTEPKQPPGAVVSPQATLLGAVVLKDEIPQTPPQPGATRFVEIIIHATATNHVDKEGSTPEITASWRE